MKELTSALVAAVGPHLHQRLTDLGIAAPVGFAEAVSEAEAWLRAALDELLTLPFARQSRGPLEVFQEAMRFPTRALAEAGTPPVRRDPAAVAALPGDLYDLAPASSRPLGDAAWEAHMAWGAAKAAAMTPAEEG